MVEQNILLWLDAFVNGGDIHSIGFGAKIKKLPEKEAFFMNFMTCLLFESGQSRDVHSGNEQMDVVRAFIRNHRF